MSETLPEVGEATMLAKKEDVILPLRSGQQMVEAFKAYQELQKALDDALPDCIQDIHGKLFRKKNYWRAVATAFGLNVEERKEERIVSEQSNDWGWIVTYRAMAPNGKYADGDGSCTALEKAEGQDTIHNVRSHAHTRAFNRAVSNLVGFGEVSAEEVREHASESQGQPYFNPAKESILTPIHKELKEAIEAQVIQNPPEGKTFEQGCAELLKHYTSYKTAKKTFPGTTQIHELSEAHARVTLDKFRRDHK